mgnify:CR=1 FL=1
MDEKTVINQGDTTIEFVYKECDKEEYSILECLVKK